MGNYDLKVGYTCNNNCIHCIVKPRIDSIKRNDEDMDFSYKEIISMIKSKEFSEAKRVVLTGGEITIRKDFIRILKYIRKLYPTKFIAIQTNGRNLSKNNLIEKMIGIPNIALIIAIHGFEETHNVISNSGKNAYTETMVTLKKLFKDRILGDKVANDSRIEIVLSKQNYKEVPVLCQEMISDYTVSSIGISYPHAECMDEDKIYEWYPSYKDIGSSIEDYYNLVVSNPTTKFSVEEFPKCIWRDSNGKLLDLSKMKNYLSVEESTVLNNTTVTFSKTEKNATYNDYFNNAHKHIDECEKCILRNNCIGVWYENLDFYKGIGLKSITEGEI